MFLTPEQVDQLQKLCEEVADSIPRNGEVTIEIRNNMPRTFMKKLPVFDSDHVLIGYTIQVYRVELPEEEIMKNRQKNRLPGKMRNEK